MCRVGQEDAFRFARGEEITAPCPPSAWLGDGAGLELFAARTAAYMHSLPPAQSALMWSLAGRH